MLGKRFAFSASAAHVLKRTLRCGSRKHRFLPQPSVNLPQVLQNPHVYMGYSLLEMALVLLILSILAGMFVSVQISAYFDKKRDITQQRMEEIQKAIIWYRQINLRVPCPGSGALTIASVDYGRQAANPGTCTGGGPAADFTGANTAAGAVPTKTLGLADDFMYDGWGRKFTYAADVRATDTCATVTYDAQDSTFGLAVKDASGADRTAAAWYVLVSHGANGHGAFLTSGERYSAGSTNANEQTNCHCDEDAGASAMTNTFILRETTEVSGDPRSRFDDLLVYAARQDIRSPADEMGQPEICP